MQIDNLEEKVKDIIAMQLVVDKSKVTPEAYLIDDLGADSLDMVELSMAFEEAFGIEIPDADAGKAVKVRDVIELIKQSITISKTPSYKKEKIKQELEKFIVALENNRVLHDIPNRSHRKIRESVINETIEKIVKIWER